MACNSPGTPASNTTATVAAGSNVTAYWSNPWLHSIGPIITWMAAVDSPAAVPTAWFKLDQAGLVDGDLPTGLWGMGEMMDDNSSWTSTVPATLRAGFYLLRNEVIALHQPGHPQFYMQWVVASLLISPTMFELARIH